MFIGNEIKTERSQAAKELNAELEELFGDLDDIELERPSGEEDIKIDDDENNNVIDSSDVISYEEGAQMQSGELLDDINSGENGIDGSLQNTDIPENDQPSVDMYNDNVENTDFDFLSDNSDAVLEAVDSDSLVDDGINIGEDRIIDGNTGELTEATPDDMEASDISQVETNFADSENEVENNVDSLDSGNDSLPDNSDYDTEELPKWYDRDTYDTFQECLEACNAYYENELLDRVNSYNGVNVEDLPDDFVSVGRNALEASSDNDASDMVETIVENGIDAEDDNDIDIEPVDADECAVNDIDNDFEDEDSDFELFGFD